MAFVEAALQKQGRQLFRTTVFIQELVGTGRVRSSCTDSLNRSCLCRHTGLGETCIGEVFQAGILVSPRRLPPE